jgi:integrase
MRLSARVTLASTPRPVPSSLRSGAPGPWCGPGHGSRNGSAAGSARRSRYGPPAQTAAFLNSIRGHRLYAGYHLIALRGLRRGEACGLRWCDIDLDAATAVIAWQLQQHGGHVTLCPPKTARSERVLALDHTTVAALRAHRAGQQAEQGPAGRQLP